MPPSCDGAPSGGDAGVGGAHYVHDGVHHGLRGHEMALMQICAFMERAHAPRVLHDDAVGELV